MHIHESIKNKPSFAHMQFLKRLQIISLEHLKYVNMNYTAHFKFSMTLSKLYARGMYFSLIHAIVPAWYTTSSTDIHEQINMEMKRRYLPYIIHKTHNTK